MKKVLIGIAAVIVLFFILFLAIACKEYIEVNAIDKTPVNISEVEDGVYEGYSETSLVKVRVRVLSQLDVLSSHEVPGCFAVVFSKSLIEIAGVAVAQHG